jgi:RNA polymerase sporulation-specific sigma factor
LKKYKSYNDYELLYLCSIHSEEALNILVNKYLNLIETKLIKYNISTNLRDDYRQESLMVLVEAIKIYDQSYSKSFCRFFELLLERRLLRLLKREKIYENIHILKEEFDSFGSLDNNLEKQGIYDKKIKEVQEIKFDEFKEKILKEIFIKGDSIKEFCKRYDVDGKYVYNHIYLIRSKLKKSISSDD